MPTATAAPRIANTLLRTAGGRSIFLRLPGPAATGDDAEQLGLATPQFNDIELGPAVFRRSNSTSTLLLSAVAVKQLLTTLAQNSAATLFAAAAGIVLDDTLYRITQTTVSQSNGEPYCYILTLQPPTP